MTFRSEVSSAGTGLPPVDVSLKGLPKVAPEQLLFIQTQFGMGATRRPRRRPIRQTASTSGLLQVQPPPPTWPPEPASPTSGGGDMSPDEDPGLVDPGAVPGVVLEGQDEASVSPPGSAASSPKRAFTKGQSHSNSQLLGRNLGSTDGLVASEDSSEGERGEMSPVLVQRLTRLDELRKNFQRRRASTATDLSDPMKAAGIRQVASTSPSKRNQASVSRSSTAQGFPSLPLPSKALSLRQPHEGGAEQRKLARPSKAQLAVPEDGPAQASFSRPASEGNAGPTAAQPVAVRAYTAPTPSQVQIVSVEDESSFQRHASENGLLEYAGLCRALADLGLQPLSAEEKLAVAPILIEAEPCNLREYQALLPRVREALRDSRREDLEETRSRMLDARGQFDTGQLKSCFEALFGLIPSAYTASEWQQAYRRVEQAIRQPPPPPSSPTPQPTLQPPPIQGGGPKPMPSLTGNLPPKPTGERPSSQGPMTPRSLYDSKPTFERAGTAERKNASNFDSNMSYHGIVEGDGPGLEAFEDAIHGAKELLIASHRERGRRLAQDLNVPAQLLQDFASEFLELHSLFARFDSSGSGSLKAEDCLLFLFACGCMEAHQTYLRDNLPRLLKVSSPTSADARKTFGRGLTVEPSATGAARSRPASSGSDDTMASPEKDSGPAWETIADKKVDFSTLLYVIDSFRQMEREAMEPHLRRMFDQQTDGRGINVRDVGRLLRDLGLQPHNREEQTEIRRLVSEADEDGAGSIAFAPFQHLVQRVAERLRRLARFEEERFAVELGLPVRRARELMQLFRELAARMPDETAISVGEPTLLLFPPELRKVMDILQRRYTSEELLELCSDFAQDQETGGLDLHGFLRMVYAVEIAKTHGQIVKPGSTRGTMVT